MSDYEQTQQTYAAEKREKSERLHAYAAEVAKLLGNGWTSTQKLDADGEPVWYATINGPSSIVDGIEITPSLHLSREWRTKRYQWSGNYPRDAKENDYLPYGAVRPQITTSAEKSPGQAARDVYRRLIPDYLALLAKCQARLNQANAYVDTTTRNVTRLAKILGREPNKSPRNNTDVSVDIHWDEVYGEVIVNGDSVEIQLRSLTVEQAERIIRFYQTTEI